MKTWIRKVVMRPYISLIVLIALTLIAIVGISRLRVDASMESLMPETDRSYLLLQRVRQIYGNRKSLLMIVADAKEPKDFLSPRWFAEMGDLVEELRSFYKGDSVANLNDIKQLASEGGYTIQIVESVNSQFDTSSENSGLEGDLDAMFLEGKEIKGGIQLDQEDQYKLDDFDRIPVDPVSKGGLHYEISGPGKDSLKLEVAVKGFSEDSIRDIQTILDGKDLQSIVLNRAELRSLLEEMMHLASYRRDSIVREIMDPILGEDVIATNDTLDPVSFVEKDENGKLLLPKTPEELETYLQRITRNPTNDSIVYAKDGSGKITATGIGIFLKDGSDYAGFTEHLFKILKKYANTELRLRTAGDLVLDQALNKANQEDTGKYIPVVLLLIILTFWLNFRSFSVTGILTVGVILAMVWTMGLMGLLSIPLTITGSILPPILVAVASSYGIHIANQYFQDLRKPDPEFPISSFVHVSPTIILASFTTMIGFFMLTVNRVKAVSDFGLLAGLGTFLSVIIAVLLIPAAFTLVRPGSKIKENTGSTDGFNRFIDFIIKGISNIVLNHSKSVIVVFLLVLGVSTVGIMKLRSDMSPIQYFPSHSKVRSDFLAVDRLLKGVYTIDLVLDSGKPGGVMEPEFLQKMEGIRKRIEEDPDRKSVNVLQVLSYADFDKRLNMAMHGDDPAFYTIPESGRTIRQFHEVFGGDDRNGDGRPDVIDGLTDPLYQRAILSIRLGETDQRSISVRIADEVRDRYESMVRSELEGTGIQYEFVGLLPTYNQLRKYITHGNLLGISLSGLVILVTVLLVFRNPGAAIVSVIPISTAIGVVYSLMGFLGITLDTATVILSSIAIGIGVDDTIHFLKTFRTEIRSGHPIAEAMERTFQEAGRAIIYTTAALFLGFSVTLLSSFTPVVNLGLLIMGVMISTTLGALLLLPSVLMVTGIRIEKTIPWMDRFSPGSWILSEKGQDHN